MHLPQPMQALPDPILEPATLEAMLDSPDLLVVDLCQPQVWRQLHIPGAVHVDPGMLVSGTPPVPGMLPPPARLRALLASIGYSPTRHIVAYDDEGGGWAGRFLWTLDMIGHPRWSYLNGGLHAWYKENHPVGTEQAEAPEPTDFDLQLDPRPIAELETVLAALDDPGVVIWDARSPEEFAGLRSGSARAGHIPGAVNLDWLELMDPQRNLRLLPLDELRVRLAARGIDGSRQIITHCQSHHRSGLSYLVARVLGYPVKAYHGSWAEWGNRDDVPVESGD